MLKQKMYISRFIISNKTGPVECQLLSEECPYYQDNIRHKSRIILTVSVLNRRGYLDIQLSREFCTHVSQKMQEWGESSKTPLNF